MSSTKNHDVPNNDGFDSTAENTNLYLSSLSGLQNSTGLTNNYHAPLGQFKFYQDSSFQRGAQTLPPTSLNPHKNSRSCKELLASKNPVQLISSQALIDNSTPVENSQLMNPIQNSVQVNSGTPLNINTLEDNSNSPYTPQRSKFTPKQDQLSTRKTLSDAPSAVKQRLRRKQQKEKALHMKEVAKKFGIDIDSINFGEIQDSTSCPGSELMMSRKAIRARIARKRNKMKNQIMEELLSKHVDNNGNVSSSNSEVANGNSYQHSTSNNFQQEGICRNKNPNNQLLPDPEPVTGSTQQPTVQVFSETNPTCLTSNSSHSQLSNLSKTMILSGTSSSMTSRNCTNMKTSVIPMAPISASSNSTAKSPNLPAPTQTVTSSTSTTLTCLQDKIPNLPVSTVSDTLQQCAETVENKASVTVTSDPNYGLRSCIRKKKRRDYLMKAKKLMQTPIEVLQGQAANVALKEYVRVTVPKSLSSLESHEHLEASKLPSSFPSSLSFRALSAYSLLRSLSFILRLGPFTPNSFLRGLAMPVHNRLIGSVHTALLRFIYAHRNIGVYHQRGDGMAKLKPFKKDEDAVNDYIARKENPFKAATENLLYLDNHTWVIYYSDYLSLRRKELKEILDIDECKTDGKLQLMRLLDNPSFVEGFNIHEYFRSRPSEHDIKEMEELKCQDRNGNYIPTDRFTSPAPYPNIYSHSSQKKNSNYSYVGQNYVDFPTQRGSSKPLDRKVSTVHNSQNSTDNARICNHFQNNSLFQSNLVKKADEFESRTSRKLPGKISLMKNIQLQVNEANRITKRGRGRPRKGVVSMQNSVMSRSDVTEVKRSRGRPRKQMIAKKSSNENMSGSETVTDSDYISDDSNEDFTIPLKKRKKPCEESLGNIMASSISSPLVHTATCSETDLKSKSSEFTNTSLETLNYVENSCTKNSHSTPSKLVTSSIGTKHQSKLSAMETPSDVTCSGSNIKAEISPDTSSIIMKSSLLISENTCLSSHQDFVQKTSIAIGKNRISVPEYVAPWLLKPQCNNPCPDGYHQKLTKNKLNPSLVKTNMGIVMKNYNMAQIKPPLTPPFQTSTVRPRLVDFNILGSIQTYLKEGPQELHGYETPFREEAQIVQSAYAAVMEALQFKENDNCSYFMQDKFASEIRTCPSAAFSNVREENIYSKVTGTIKDETQGVSYHSLPISKKIAILEYLLDEILSLDLISGELLYRHSSSFHHDFLYGKLPNSKQLEHLTNMDECSVCGLEGDLLCCDSCIGSFHRRCINIPLTRKLGEGKWLCPECKLVDPSKVGPLNVKSKGSIDWFQLKDLESCTHLFHDCRTVNYGEFRHNRTQFDLRIESCIQSEDNIEMYKLPQKEISPKYELFKNLAGIEFLIVHGFVFARDFLSKEPFDPTKVDSHLGTNESMLKTKGSYTQQPLPLEPKQLFVLLTMLGPEICMQWPWSQIPLDPKKIWTEELLSSLKQLNQGIDQVFQPNAITHEISICFAQKEKEFTDQNNRESVVEERYRQYEQYCCRQDAFNPLVYVNDYHKAPLHRNVSSQMGSNTVRFDQPILDMENHLFRHNLSRDQSFDHVLARLLRENTLLYEPIKPLRDYILRLEKCLKSASLLHECWGLKNSSDDQGLWSKNVSICKSVGNIAKLFVSLIDYTHPRAFHEEWNKLPGITACSDLDYDDESKPFHNLPKGWRIDAEVLVRKWDRCCDSNILNLLVKESGNRKILFQQNAHVSESSSSRQKRKVDAYSFSRSTSGASSVVPSNGNECKMMCKDSAGGNEVHDEGSAVPKRNMSSYHFFLKEKRDELKSKGMSFRGDQFTKEYSQTWKHLKSEEREPFKEAAKRDKIRYEEELKAFEEKKNKKSDKEKSRDKDLNSSASKARRRMREERNRRRSDRRQLTNVLHHQLDCFLGKANKTSLSADDETFHELTEHCRNIKILRLERIIQEPFEKETHWPLAGRRLFVPEGSLPKPTVQRLGRNAGITRAPFVTYASSFEVGLPSVCQLWRKKTLTCRSFEELFFQIRFIDSYIHKQNINICESITRKALNPQESVAKEIKGTMINLGTGSADYFVSQQSKNGKLRGRWVPEEFIDSSTLISHRLSRIINNKERFTVRVAKKRKAEIERAKQLRIEEEKKCKLRKKILKLKKEKEDSRKHNALLDKNSEVGHLAEKSKNIAKQTNAKKRKAKKRKAAVNNNEHESKVKQGIKRHKEESNDTLEQSHKEINQIIAKHKNKVNKLLKVCASKGLTAVPVEMLNPERASNVSLLLQCNEKYANLSFTDVDLMSKLEAAENAAIELYVSDMSRSKKPRGKKKVKRRYIHSSAQKSSPNMPLGAIDRQHNQTSSGTARMSNFDHAFDHKEVQSSSSHAQAFEENRCQNHPESCAQPRQDSRNETFEYNRKSTAISCDMSATQALPPQPISDTIYLQNAAYGYPNHNGTYLNTFNYVQASNNSDQCNVFSNLLSLENANNLPSIIANPANAHLMSQPAVVNGSDPASSQTISNFQPQYQGQQLYYTNAQGHKLLSSSDYIRSSVISEEQQSLHGSMYNLNEQNSFVSYKIPDPLTSRRQYQPDC